MDRTRLLVDTAYFDRVGGKQTICDEESEAQVVFSFASPVLGDDASSGDNKTL